MHLSFLLHQVDRVRISVLLSVTSAIGSTNGRTPQYLYNLAANRRQVDRNISDMPYVHPALLRSCLHKCSTPTENPSQARTPFPRRTGALKRRFWTTVIVTLKLTGVAEDKNETRIDRLFMISWITRHQIEAVRLKRIAWTFEKRVAPGSGCIEFRRRRSKMTNSQIIKN